MSRVADDEHYRKLERMYLSAPTNQYYQPSIRVSEGKAEVEVAVRDDFFHTAGAVHGSVYFKIIDDASFFAVNSLVVDVFVLTISLTLYVTRPVTEGTMRGSAHVVNASRRLFVTEAEAFDANGRIVATGVGSFMRSEIPLSPAIGYA
jgi:uncharacterized protein (TIGR00369 family)